MRVSEFVCVCPEGQDACARGEDWAKRYEWRCVCVCVRSVCVPVSAFKRVSQGTGRLHERRGGPRTIRPCGRTEVGVGTARTA